MSYGLPDSVGGDSPSNDKWMEDCVAKVKKQGKKKGNAIAICKVTLQKHKGNQKDASIEVDKIINMVNQE
jgi:hypothetical protein